MISRGGKFLILILVLAVAAPVEAQRRGGGRGRGGARGGGVRGAATGLKDSTSMKGLCVKSDSNERWVARGWCKTIREQLTVPPCAYNVFNELRQKATRGDIRGLADYCTNIKEIAADHTHFAAFMTNLMAVLAIEESDWSEKGPDSSMGAKGVMQLSLASVKQKAYACGCSDIKSNADIYNAHKNVKCGSWIALHWINKDNAVGDGSTNKACSNPGGPSGPGSGGGRSRQPTKGSGSCGAARYFQPFRDIDTVKRDRMKKKMGNYCRQRGSGIDLEQPAGANSNIVH